MDRLPDPLLALASVLPEAEGPDLESHLQTFDMLLEFLPASSREPVVALIRNAAAESKIEATRERLERAAADLEKGGRAARPYHHASAMKAYREAHQANYPPQQSVTPDPLPEPRDPPPRWNKGPSPPSGGRVVDERLYQKAIHRAGVIEDTDYRNYGGIGEIERWVDEKTGQPVAWIYVRYFRGEHEFDFYVAS